MFGDKNSGTAAIAAPVMGPVGDVLISSFGDTIIVELGLHTGFELGVKVCCSSEYAPQNFHKHVLFLFSLWKAADDLLIADPIKHVLPTHDHRLATTAIKSLTITLKYKHTTTDAALGFFRASTHADPSLFSSIKDYLAVCILQIFSSDFHT